MLHTVGSVHTVTAPTHNHVIEYAQDERRDADDEHGNDDVAGNLMEKICFVFHIPNNNLLTDQREVGNRCCYTPVTIGSATRQYCRYAVPLPRVGFITAGQQNPL